MTADAQARRGAAYIVASALAFATMGALVKRAAPEVPTPTIVFLRNLFGVLVLLPWLWRGGRATLATRFPGLHALRTLSGLAGMYCFFGALALLPLSEAVLFNYSAPLFIPLVALLWLHEPFPPRLRWAVALGFVGVLIVLRPTGDFRGTGTLLGIAAALFTAVAMTAIRRLTHTEPPLRIVAWFGLGATAVSAVPLLWTWQPLAAQHWALLLALGAAASLGQILMTRGYALAPAGQAGAWTYTTVVFAALLGWLGWDETPDLGVLAGALLIAGSGMLALRGARP